MAITVPASAGTVRQDAPASGIRRLHGEDLSALLALYGHLHPGGAPPHPETAARTWARITGDLDLLYLGAEVAGELAATCTIAIIPNLTHGARSHGLIENVVTAPRHRRRGLGTALLHAACAYAWERGCYKVTLTSGRRDPATLRFYAAAGFDPALETAFVARP